MTAYTVSLTITKEAERLRRVDDPAKRAQEARKVSAAIKRGEIELAEVVRACVRELRDEYGLSWTQVAEAIGGVTHARAQQIYSA